MFVAETVTADTTGTVSLPLGTTAAVPGQQIVIIAAAAVVLLGSASASAAGATIPANVPVALPAGTTKVFLRAPTGTVAVSYYYQTS